MLGWRFFPSGFIFFTKVHLLAEGQIAVISDTDNHVALSRFPETFPCPRLCLTLSFAPSPTLQFS